MLCQGHLLIEGEGSKILLKIQKSKDFDEAVVKAVEELKKSLTKQLRSEECQKNKDWFYLKKSLCAKSQ